MRRAAVICEFNPFHNGHKFLLEKIKTSYADEIICIMSGNFVQRGDIAIVNKYERTKTALQNGADMVAELPTVYALAPAQIFAENGVRLAHELGCERLCFGAENSNEELKEALDALDEDKTQQEIAAQMQKGSYYPKALSNAVGEKYADIISKPNNILALEYIRACRRYQIEPIAVKRVGVEHDSDKAVRNIASASFLRERIKNGEDCSDFTPCWITKPHDLSDIEPILLFLLKTSSPEDTASIAGISEGLNNRIYKIAQQYNSLEEILSAVKTKRYTMSRLRRTILSIGLRITEEYRQTPVPYIRVLGFRKESQTSLSSVSLPLIIDVKRGYDSLPPFAKAIFDVDIRAAELYNSAKAEQPPQNEFLHGVIKI